MQPGSASAALNISDSLRSLSPYHLEPIASRGTYTSGTDAWLAITLALVVLPVPACPPNLEGLYNNSSKLRQYHSCKTTDTSAS